MAELSRVLDRRPVAGDDSGRVVYPLLRQHLDQTEQTDLADAIDEILAARERAP
jgi:hypothetical protein